MSVRSTKLRAALKMKAFLLLLSAALLCSAVYAQQQPAGTYLATRFSQSNTCAVAQTFSFTLVRTGTTGGGCVPGSESSSYKTCNATHSVSWSCTSNNCGTGCTVSSSTFPLQPCSRRPQNFAHVFNYFIIFHCYLALRARYPTAPSLFLVAAGFWAPRVT